MPDSSNHSGQCDSVTEDPLLSNTDRGKTIEAGRVSQTNVDLANTSSAASALTISSASLSATTRHPFETYNRSDHTRAVSASATTRALDNSALLPPSPPSSPSQSPPANSASSAIWPAQEISSQTEQELRSALVSIRHRCDNEDGSRTMPDTPGATPSTISPVDGMGLHHRPTSSLREFVRSVLPNIIPLDQPGKVARQLPRYVVEDAGMELVSHGWTGAVLIDTRLTCTTPLPAISNSSSPGATRSRLMFGSTRMSRASSASSSTYAVERSSPRRTLLTRMASNSNLTSEALRTRILDVLDHATEKLHADNVVFVLDRTSMDEEHFCAIVHGLCYVGATIVGYGATDGNSDLSQQAMSQNTKSLSSDVEVEESIYAPRRISPNLVLLSVEV